MDADRFDRLARTLAASASRRRVLRGLTGGVLGGVLGLVGLEEAAAACRLSGQRCSPANACCNGARCLDGRCRCKTGQGFEACNGPGTKCVNTNTSEQHCGACDQPCPTGAVCIDGVCTCPPGTEACDGACRTACPTGQTRDPASCQCIVPCVPDCSGKACGGDGCGGSCGTCSAIDCNTALCSDGACSYTPTGVGGVSCNSGAGTCDTLGNCGPNPGGPGTCPADSDYCATGNVVACNGSDACHCYGTASGERFCGTGPAVCADCNTDADCAGFGVGAACVDLGTNCSSCSSSTPTHVCMAACTAA